jgi:hypothetical protein
LRLDPRFLTALLATFAVLFLTGVGWLAIDQSRGMALSEAAQAASADLLAVHGGVAMIALLLIGAILPMHVRIAWRLRRNRVTGVVMLGTNALLIATAFALYYAGAEGLRAWASDLHIAAGLALPIIIAVHAIIGRRSTRRAWAVERSTMPDRPSPRRAAARAAAAPHRVEGDDERIT